MIEKLREFVQQSKIIPDVGSLIVNRELTILATTEAISTWLSSSTAALDKQPLGKIFPELVGFETLLTELLAKNDPRLTIQLPTVNRPQAGKPQQFHLEAQCTSRPGFLMLTMNLITAEQTTQSDIDKKVRERTAELVQVNVLLEWEIDQLKQQQKSPRPTPQQTLFYPQVGFS